MQVVYSGGSTTPTPSPRLQRKTFQGGYGRPVLPGYLAGPHPPVVVHRSKEKLTEGDTSLRDSIPAMSKPVAVICLVFNIIVPGLGTFIAGLSVLCCSEVRPKGATKRSVVWVNTGVAALQFVTAFLFLLGWIWSIMWGVAFLSVSDEDRMSPAQHARQEHPVKISPKRQRDHHASTSHLQHHSNGSPAYEKHLQELYLTPTSSTNQTQPIIVLQQPPVVNHSEEKKSPSRPIMNARTRHQKILQRQMSDNQLSPFTLTHQNLEAIVIHDAVPRPRVPRQETVESVESVSDDEIPIGKS